MRNSAKVLAAVGALALMLSGSDASAQRRRGLVDISDRHERHGAWLNIALGAGSENYRYSDDPTGWRRRNDLNKVEDLTKPSFSIAAGGTINPHFRLGGELNAWVNQYSDLGVGYTETLVGGLLVGQVYPVRNLGLYIKGGLGISRSGSSVDNGGSDLVETGFSYLYGAGYEIKLARNFFLSPAISVMQHSSTSGNQNIPNNGGTLHERVWTIGVGLTFQPGR